MNVKDCVNRYDVLNRDEEDMCGCECKMIRNVEFHDIKRIISSKKKYNKNMDSKLKCVKKHKKNRVN